MMFTLPFAIRRRGYHVATDEIVSGRWKLAVRLKLTAIRHAWVLVSRDPSASDITNEALRILAENME